MQNLTLSRGGDLFVVCRHHGQSFLVQISPEDLELVSSIKGTWGITNSAGNQGRTNSPYYYACFRSKGKTVYMHRFLKDSPAGMVVDHQNGDTLDNTRSNLRVMTQAENVKRRRIVAVWGKSNTGVPNVTQYKGRFRVQIAGRWYGDFQSLDEANAVAKRKRAAINAERAAA